MRTNIAKAKITRGEVALGTLCTTASPLMAEALGHAGFDFVVVDLQHGENNLGNLSNPCCRPSARRPRFPLVRVPANMPMYIQRALDLGAYGIVVPLVDTLGGCRRGGRARCATHRKASEAGDRSVARSTAVPTISRNPRASS